MPRTSRPHAGCPRAHARSRPPAPPVWQQGLLHLALERTLLCLNGRLVHSETRPIVDLGQGGALTCWDEGGVRARVAGLAPSPLNPRCFEQEPLTPPHRRSVPPRRKSRREGRWRGEQGGSPGRRAGSVIRSSDRFRLVSAGFCAA